MGLFDCGHTHMAAHSLSPDVPFVSCSNIKRRSAYTIIIILAAAFHFWPSVNKFFFNFRRMVIPPV
jgi:hypothetical protein